MAYDSTKDTLEHIMHVRDGLGWVVQEMTQRAEDHDRTKMGPEEKAIYDEFTPKLKDCTFNSPEYLENLKQMGEALKHHYASYRHHPENGYQHEGWHAVPNFEGHYEVSTLGRVRSLDRTVCRGDSELPKKGRMLRLSVTPKGYLRVQLRRDGKHHNKLVHRLVAETFLVGGTSYQQVNHRNGNKQDNSFGNLEWVTPSENLQHAYDTELRVGSVKYVVECEELELVTFGMDKMAEKASALTGKSVRASGIWNAVHTGGLHCGLSFTASRLEERGSMLGWMNLLDLLEMLIDWRASTKRHTDGDVMRSVEVLQKKFGYSDELKGVLVNTVHWLKAQEESRAKKK